MTANEKSYQVVGDRKQMGEFQHEGWAPELELAILKIVPWCCRTLEKLSFWGTSYHWKQLGQEKRWKSFSTSLDHTCPILTKQPTHCPSSTTTEENTLQRDCILVVSSAFSYAPKISASIWAVLSKGPGTPKRIYPPDTWTA